MKNTPIKENHLYQKAYAKGKSAPGKYVAVYTLPDRQNHRYVKADPCHRPVNRLGLTTGKKIGGAVVRSRARRLMREAYRLIEDEGNLLHGNLIVRVGGYSEYFNRLSDGLKKMIINRTIQSEL